MKYVPPALLPALIAVLCAMTACKTTSDRFDLFSPDKPHGPATQRSRGMTLAGRYDHRSTTYTYPVTVVGPQPPAEQGPIAPPPPPPPPSGTPESNLGVPAATPFPSSIPSPSTSAVPGLSNPVTTAPPPTAPAPAAPPAASPPPAIPGLSQ